MADGKALIVSLPEKEWSGPANFKRSRLRAALSTRIRPRAILEKAKEAARRAKKKEKVRAKERGVASEISLAIPQARTSKREFAICMFIMDNAPIMIAHIPTYPKIKSSMQLGKAAPISGIRPARATMRTRIHADAEKGKERERERKARGMIVHHQEEKTQMESISLPNWSATTTQIKTSLVSIEFERQLSKRQLVPVPAPRRRCGRKYKVFGREAKGIGERKELRSVRRQGRSPPRNKKGKKKWRNNSAGSD